MAKNAPTTTKIRSSKNFKNNQIPRNVHSSKQLPFKSSITLANLIDKNSATFSKIQTRHKTCNVHLAFNPKSSTNKKCGFRHCLSRISKLLSLDRSV